MSNIRIKRAGHSDAEQLHEALTQLSGELGDAHTASLDDLVRHGFSETPAFFALIASRQADSRAVGALLASPVFSTTRGGAGLYVSDLWVAEDARGAGLAQQLLAAAIEDAPDAWTVTFLKLSVYHDNPKARRFYERLGFQAREDETVFDLQKPALDNLRKRP